MTPPDEQPTFIYASAVPLDAARPRAVVISCSDGRWGRQCDDFVDGALGLPPCDRLTVPGGPACLAGHFAAYHEGDAVAAQLGFLVEVHQLQRVVLIAHQDCAFYTALLGASPIGLAPQQQEDLVKAAARISEIGPGLEVEAYFACKHGALAGFERVDV